MADSEKVSSLPSFTPGPWVFHESSRRATFDVYGREDSCYRIGEVSNHNGFPENEANAHLIVAAPDLYDALQELLSVNADPAPGWSADLLMDKAAFRQFLDGCDARKKAAEDKARAAIVKAKHGG